MAVPSLGHERRPGGRRGRPRRRTRHLLPSGVLISVYYYSSVTQKLAVRTWRRAGFSLRQSGSQIRAEQPGREASFQAVAGPVGFRCGLPALGAALFIREVRQVLGVLLATQVRVEALEGQNPVPLPPVQLVYANPFSFGLWVCENSVPTQAFVDLVGEVLFYFSKMGETYSGGVRGDGPVFTFVLFVLLPGAMIFAGT